MVRHFNTQQWIIVSVSALVWLGSCLLPQSGCGQDARPTADQGFRGVERCESCHRGPTPVQVERGVTNFVHLNESLIWQSDIHSQAFTLIDPVRSELSAHICRQLNIPDIRAAQACLSCHSNWLQGHERPPTFERGVACESCHGPSRRWDGEHTEESWRAKSVVDKEALGMIDVRNPVKRAEQCFSCHIGNAAQGKVVTHAMYAAGHPPLPSIEIESFAQQMPRHWRYPSEKVSDSQSATATVGGADKPFKFFDEFIRENHQYLLPAASDRSSRIIEHQHGAAAVVLGGVVALRESIELLHDLSGATTNEGAAWPELAAFDCAACHQELSASGSSPARRANARLGRPTLPAWPNALVRLAILHISPDRPSYEKMLAEFQSKLAAVEVEFVAAPFGNPRRIAAPSAALSDWLTSELITDVAEKPFDRAAVRRSFNMLVRIGSTETHDYASARQLAWALRTLHCDLTAETDQREPIRAVIAELTTDLQLDLPNGGHEVCASRAATPGAREFVPLSHRLPDALSAAARYDPEQFRQRMQTLTSQK